MEMNALKYFPFILREAMAKDVIYYLVTLQVIFNTPPTLNVLITSLR